MGTRYEQKEWEQLPEEVQQAIRDYSARERERRRTLEAQPAELEGEAE
jgi:TRAP-type C4-dicarboxylate transport system substrate-binding protein